MKKLLRAGEVNRLFFNAVIMSSPDGTKGGFARAIEINPARITELIKGYRRPSESEYRKLSTIFSPYMMKRFFPPKPEAEQIKGTEAINE